VNGAGPGGVRPSGPPQGAIPPGGIPTNRAPPAGAPAAGRPQTFNKPPNAPRPPAAAPSASQAPSAVPAAVEAAGIAPTTLSSASPMEQKQMLGEVLYMKIVQTQPELAGKITGMLLEMDNAELLHLLENNEALNGKVTEAISVLNEFSLKDQENN